MNRTANRDFEEFMLVDRPDMRWDITNSGAEAATTISLEALKTLSDHMTTWVATRLAKRMAAGRSAKHPIVTVTVAFEDDPVEQGRIERARDESHR